jgi:bromodomain-containing protein 7
VSLTEWVKKNIVDHLTNGNHAILLQTSDGLQDLMESIGTAVSTQITRSRYLYPQATEQMQELLRIYAQQIDMTCLLKNPAELLASDCEWLRGIVASQDVSSVKQEEDDSKAVVDDGQKMNYGSPFEHDRSIAMIHETSELMTVALNNVAEGIIELNRYHQQHGGKVENGDAVDEEASELRDIRMHLISLAKRAPLNQIAGLPPDLVPPTLRQYVSLVS